MTYQTRSAVRYTPKSASYTSSSSSGGAYGVCNRTCMTHKQCTCRRKR